jgi:hypothetical protein
LFCFEAKKIEAKPVHMLSNVLTIVSSSGYLFIFRPIVEYLAEVSGEILQELAEVFMEVLAKVSGCVTESA